MIFDEFDIHTDKEYINLTGLVSTDAINSEGLFVQGNAREQGDYFYNTGTNPGKLRARVDMLPGLITQNCATVKEAVEFVKNELDVYSTPKKNEEAFTELAYLMGDATGEYGILEIAGNNIYFLPYQNGQANYYLNPICNSIDVNGSGYGRLSRLTVSLMGDNAREYMSPEKNEIIFKCKDIFMKNGYKEMLLEYYKGNEKPLRDCANVWTTGLQLSVNCKKKNIIVRFFEKENLTFELDCNKILGK